MLVRVKGLSSRVRQVNGRPGGPDKRPCFLLEGPNPLLGPLCVRLGGIVRRSGEDAEEDGRHHKSCGLDLRRCLVGAARVTYHRHLGP